MAKNPKSGPKDPVPVEIISPIIGTISYLSIPDGNTVVQGEEICQIECMKTFYPVYAPKDGKLRYRLMLGDMVSDGEVIAEII
jgi:biotin carboxyl carrier protein